MSYSRWSNSVWYSYYACSYSYERDEQAFDICDVKCFYYKELKNNLEDCIKKVKEQCPEVSDLEIEELKGYIGEFISDVESDIALNLVQDIKKAKFEELPELYKKLSNQVSGTYEKDVYEDLLEDLNKLLFKPASEKADLRTDIGRSFFDKKLLIPINNRFDLLKSG